MKDPQEVAHKRTLKPKRKLKPHRSKPKHLRLKPKSRHKKKLPGHTIVGRAHTASYQPHVQLQQSVPKPIDQSPLADPDDDAHVGYEDILYDGHVGYEDIF
eukprot:362665_1